MEFSVALRAPGVPAVEEGRLSTSLARGEELDRPRVRLSIVGVPIIQARTRGRAVSERTSEGKPRGCRGESQEQRADPTGKSVEGPSALDEPDSFKTGGAECCVAAHESDPQHGLQFMSDMVGEYQPCQQAEQKRTCGVDDHRSHGEGCAQSGADQAVQHETGACAEAAGHRK